MTETIDLILAARENLGEECETELEACEAFWGHGVADEEYGNTDEPPCVHQFRVAHCIVVTNQSGQKLLEKFSDEEVAHAVFEVRARNWEDQMDVAS